MAQTLAVSRETIAATVEPLGLEKVIKHLEDLGEWLSNLPLDDPNDVTALYAAIGVLKLLR